MSRLTQMVRRKDKRILRALASGKYLIKRDGRVFDVDFRGRGTCRQPRMFRDKDGYVRFHLSGVRQVLLHRVIALHFLPRKRGEWYVHHKNWIYDDNRTANLMWGNAPQVRRASFAEGRQKAVSGERHHFSRMTASTARRVHVLLAAGEKSVKEISRLTGVGEGALNGMRGRSTWARLRPGGLPTQQIKTKRGQRNGRARLKESDVKIIKKLLKKGITKADLARTYGVGWTTVQHIESGRTWGWLRP